jgi:hypothetical protein
LVTYCWLRRQAGSTLKPRARKEVGRLRPGRKGSPETVEQFAQQWKEKESRRAFSSSEPISGYLANRVVPAWGSRLLNEAVDVEGKRSFETALTTGFEVSTRIGSGHLFFGEVLLTDRVDFVGADAFSKGFGDR